MSLVLMASVLLAIAPIDSTPAHIAGTVSDSAGHLLPIAEVRLDSAETWQHVSAAARFSFADVAPGRHLIEARAVGYARNELHLKVDAGDALSIGLTLSRAVVLSDVKVKAQADAPPPPPHDWNEGFDERRAHNVGGVFLNQAEIDRRGAMRMTELLRSVPGVTLHGVRNDYGGIDYVILMRGTAVVDARTCPIQYYLDGHPYTQPDDIDRLISPHQISAMEIYPGSSHVPEQFKGPTARCGVIAIWSKSNSGGR